MSIDEMSDICEHLTPGTYPFQVDLVLDDHLGFTDAVVSCRHCQQAYLLEMLDWANHDRLFRICVLRSDHAQRLIRDLTRGSCDLQRAGAEVQQMKTASAFSGWLILVDTVEPQISAVAPVPPERDLPGASWRELPCDGTWVKYARGTQPGGSGRSNTAIEKG
ncbi:MAG: hypothetical protein O7B25_06805 [Gammaproteobacteria bacterium]|nr:hypothetical protein [Gammaproteobacteria bacterium]